MIPTKAEKRLGGTRIGRGPNRTRKNNADRQPHPLNPEPMKGLHRFVTIPKKTFCEPLFASLQIDEFDPGF